MRVVAAEILSFKREVVIDAASQGRLNSIGEGRAESEQHRRPGAGVLGLASGGGGDGVEGIEGWFMMDGMVAVAVRLTINTADSWTQG